MADSPDNHISLSHGLAFRVPGLSRPLTFLNFHGGSFPHLNFITDGAKRLDEQQMSNMYNMGSHGGGVERGGGRKIRPKLGRRRACKPDKPRIRRLNSEEPAGHPFDVRTRSNVRGRNKLRPWRQP